MKGKNGENKAILGCARARFLSSAVDGLDTCRFPDDGAIHSTSFYTRQIRHAASSHANLGSSGIFEKLSGDYFISVQ